MTHLLIIEDNVRVAQAIQLMLDFAMYTADFVQDGQKALEALQNASSALPDVIVANVIMPGMDGFHICRVLKQTPELAHLPVILVGPADAEPGDESLAKRAGAAGFLRKPLERDAFLGEVDRVMLLAPVQANPLAKPLPQEEGIFLRDYNVWLTRMMVKIMHQAETAQETVDMQHAHLDAINKVTTALGQSLDLHDTGKALVHKTADLMRAQAVAIYIFEEDTNCFEHLYTAGVGIPTPGIVRQYVLDEYSPVEPLKNGDQSLLFDDPIDLEALQQAFSLTLFPTSAIASPLIARGILTGFLLVMRTSRDDFYTPQDARTLFSLAGAAGLAVRSAQLFTSLDHAYSELQDLDRRKSEFVAITSHELRTPIAIMLGYASLLADDEHDSSRKSQLEAIEKQAHFLSGMVDALINLHELQGKSQPILLNCQSVRVDKLLEEAVEAARSSYKNTRDVLVDLKCDPVEIVGDEVRLVLAFTNLVDNAIKFNKDGGHVHITAVGLPEGGAVITFEDDGIGIPENEYEKIFEPFYQLEGALTRRYGGMGLGLAIVKGMIELHDGTIVVKSRMEAGTRFVVTLRQHPPDNRCMQ